MINDAAILTWAGLALLVTVTPGPDTMLVIGHALKGGARAGLAAAGGIAAGFVWYAALAWFGFMAILAASPFLYTLVKIAGALYLAWIGVQMIAGAIRPKPDEQGKVALGAPFRQGLLTNALNPKVALFYLAALPQFLPAGPEAPARAVLLIGVHYALGAAWLSFVAVSSARAGRVLGASPLMRGIEGLVGAALIGLGARLLFERRA